ncbi:MAG: hypothetical protein IJF75_07050 [Clostridia bacterium]|nr:hypothetical protein [Clostridia bacterium]
MSNSNFYDSYIEHLDIETAKKNKQRSKQLKLSQKAHKRLEDKAIKNNDYDSMVYHNYVSYQQAKRNCVLSSAERKRIYRKLKNQ